MADGPIPGSAKSAIKRGLIAFLVVDAIFIAGAVALYFWIVRPQMAQVEAARDAVVRSNIAMSTRVRAVEARLALAKGDTAGAKNAAADIQAQLAGLLARIPKANTSEAAEVMNLGSRAALIGNEIGREPETARKDLELIEAHLAALYPAAAAK